MLFDIDGTLAQSQSLDSEIHVQSLRDVFGFTGVSADWSSYRHATDGRILEELCQVRLGRTPTAAESSRFRNHFVGAIRVAAVHSPFHEIRGAGQMLRVLTNSPRHRVGGWAETARSKMRSAGMNYDAFPAACADDAISRTEIMRIALERVNERAATGESANFVYVGEFGTREPAAN